LQPGQRFTIDEIAADGRPLAPKKHVTAFVKQCGVIVRDTIPITVQEWHKPKKAPEGVTYVDDRSKDELWENVVSHFNLPAECNKLNADGTPNPEGLKRRLQVKAWALKKMAELFRNHKKVLNKKFLMKKKTPTFKGTYEKMKDQWEEFKAYRESRRAQERSEINKKNAAKKKYHHIMGPGGYRNAVPKWIAMEEALIAKGIPLGTEGWDERAVHWFYGHGGTLHPETGECVIRKQIVKPTEELVKAMAEAQEGLWQAERENDALTRALGNPERGGRVRGKGSDVTWKEGFPEHVETYRSRERRKNREKDRIQRIESDLAGVKKSLEEIKSQRSSQPHEDQLQLENSQRRSSVASTELPDDDRAMDDAPAPHYPVDNPQV